MTTDTFDITVIGAGIAGASVAANLAKHAKVLLVDKESHPGYHSTGRSAAVYIPSYGPPWIQALTKASGEFFNHPPDGFCSTPLLSGPRPEMLIAREDQMPAVETFISSHLNNPNISAIDAVEVRERCPILKKNYAAGGIVDTSSSDIDVATLHQGYLRTFNQLGGTLVTDCNVAELTNRSGTWIIETTAGKYKSGIIINAAGAWADEVAKYAGAESIGLVPKRRTAILIKAPASLDTASMPLVADIDEAFYIKPEPGNLLLSPANEDPMPACDVQPEEIDIALCIDQIERAFDIQVNSIVRTWAGLRSFVADKEPVAGFSNRVDNFFYLAGQGGYGIQSSPALARYAASLILGDEIPDDLIHYGLDENSLCVQRLATAHP